MKNVYNSIAQNQTIWFKNVQKIKIDFFFILNKTYRQPTGTLKMLGITRQQGNTNQKYNEVSSHTC